MQFSPHKPHNVPERFAASVAKVCTTASFSCRLSVERHQEMEAGVGEARKSERRKACLFDTDPELLFGVRG